ncbi:RING finger protein 141-like [Diaphorina citri]|uniref:RING finger protein 141-like n=1 Tax=Diaphorina citri TaxID=121845 RepID=A0A3Q0JB14_DIACI|nr:RING finger protein 141-like [Diaphorina citri]
MGQSESINKLTEGVDTIQEEIVKHAKAISEITSITYEEFLQHLFHINTLFAIKKGTDSTVFWKGTIRIAVIRKNIQSSALETSKLLNLSQFLKFAIKKGTDSTVFWKGTIRIAVIRKNIQSSTLETSKLLNLSQFLKIVKTLDDMIKISQDNGSSSSSDVKPITASMLLEVVNVKTEQDKAVSVSSGDSNDSCVICFENKPDIVLPCMHSFCHKCIDSW